MENSSSTPSDNRNTIWFYSNTPQQELQGNQEIFDQLLMTFDGYMDEFAFSEALRLFKIIGLKLPAGIAAIESFADYPDLSEEDAGEFVGTLTAIGSDSDYKKVVDTLLARFPKLRREKLGISYIKPT